MRPCFGFVVELMAVQAAMQDPYHSVGQLARRGVMGDATSAQLVVVAPGTRRCRQCGVGLAPERIDEAVVVHVTGKNVLFLSPTLG